MTVDLLVTPGDLFAAALRGQPVELLDDTERSRPLAVWRWSVVNDYDQALLDACHGPTLDIGCGPGRMTAGLARSGRVALGIDVVSEAVEQTRARGADALVRDVFDEVPGHGRWRSALLADGNIGIGGDPVRLLSRVRDLLAPGGRAVVDLAAPGRRGTVRQCRLSTEGRISDAFPWAVVGVDSIEALATASGLTVLRTEEYGGRWFAVLGKQVRTVPAAVRPPRESDFTSHLRSPAVAARIGVALGTCFGIAFLTGLVSHWAQDPMPWFFVPTRPSWGYRLTQGLHVASGTAAIPLLLVKLWTVFPRLFTAIPSPRRRRIFLVHLLERGSIAVLVASAIFMLATGLLNTSQWYPWDFTFRRTHNALGWIAIGALLVHIAVKLPVIRRALGEGVTSSAQDRPTTAAAPSGLTRRGLLRTTWAASGLAVVASAGSTVPLLRTVSVFGVRSGNGPSGIPINKSAEAAGVLGSATSAGYVLAVVGTDREVRLTADRLLGLGTHDAALPIACVEGWSASGTWTGPRISDLVAMVGAPEGSDVRVTSLQEHGPYRATLLPASYVEDRTTLLATHLNGERLSIDHGFPCRVIAPNRPGVLQTKWVTRLEVL